MRIFLQAVVAGELKIRGKARKKYIYTGVVRYISAG
jgi:hypothetical protein